MGYTKDKTEQIKFKVSEKEKNQIELLADLYAGGDVSAWLRYAAINVQPKKIKSSRKEKSWS